MSGRNTKIAKSKLAWGVKLPHETMAVGEGYACNGPVTTYTISQDEIVKRYGPIKRPRKKTTPLYEYWCRKKEVKNVIVTINANETTINANENPETCANGAILRNDEQRSAKPVGGVEIYKADEILDSVDEGKQSKRPRTRLEAAREKLSKEMYLDMKAEGLSDSQLRKQHDIATDTLIALKREWGLEIRTGFAPRAAGPEQSQKQPESDSSGQREQGITITQAITLHDELEEELECLDYMLDPQVKMPLTSGLRLLLEGRRCESARQLKRIHDVFDAVTVAI